MAGRVNGGREVARNMGRMSDGFKRELSRAVRSTAETVRSTAIKSIQRGPATGAVYDSIFRTFGGRVVPVGPRQGNNLSATHQASAPGEAPNTDSGDLASSINVAQRGSMNAIVYTMLAYGRYLEHGTQAMAARPWLMPALRESRDTLRSEVQSAYNRAARKVDQ